jgi:hypothetical protein
VCRNGVDPDEAIPPSSHVGTSPFLYVVRATRLTLRRKPKAPPRTGGLDFGAARPASRV